MSIPSISPANLAVIEKQKNQQSANVAVQKTETTGNNKKIMLALAGLATIGLATIGIYALTKNHKRVTEAGQDFSRRGEDLLQGLTGKPSKSTGAIEDAKKLSNKLAELQQLKTSSTIETADGIITFEKEVPTIKTSVADDVANWKKIRETAPKYDDKTPINTDFDEFIIVPHQYTDDTEILIRGKDYTCDFSVYKVEDGKISKLENARLSEYTREKDSSCLFEIQPDKRCLQTGIFEDGRKYVSCAYQLGETDEAGRIMYETIMLVSKGKEFTQSQKDLIKAFECSKGKRFKNDIPPMIFGKYVPSGCKSLPYNQAIFLENRNALLSAIYSWSKNVGEFDIEKYLQTQGDIFRIGR
ncbi:MAG: hypothetical protein IKU37_00550 [Candidatus Gastranaerophilales bacterium]|nr:hypothetical protein [Candidatus Gastranaerophilales bacterium]